MNLTGIFDFIVTLPPFIQVILGVILIGIIFAVARRLVKFALSLAALVILGLVIFRLMQ